MVYGKKIVFCLWKQCKYSIVKFLDSQVSESKLHYEVQANKDIMLNTIKGCIKTKNVKNEGSIVFIKTC